MNPITRISPVSDAAAARLAAAATHTALAADIARSPLPAHRLAVRVRQPARRRLLVMAPIAVIAAVGGLVAMSLSRPGHKIGPIDAGAKPPVEVLSFTRHGGYLDVVVTNPLADAKRFRAEFATYGLDISVKLVPASPSVVGTLVYFDGSTAIKPITAVGRCFTGGGGNVCPVGVRVPLDFEGAASLVFGRAARPGEQYETSAPATAPGEAMHGMHYAGQTVSAVVAMLRARDVTVPQYRVLNSGCITVAERTVPGSWYVDDAIPWAGGQVLLFASSTWPARTCAAPGGPVPVPAVTGHGR